MMDKNKVIIACLSGPVLIRGADLLARGSCYLGGDAPLAQVVEEDKCPVLLPQANRRLPISLSKQTIS